MSNKIKFALTGLLAIVGLSVIGIIYSYGLMQNSQPQQTKTREMQVEKIAANTFLADIDISGLDRNGLISLLNKPETIKKLIPESFKLTGAEKEREKAVEEAEKQLLHDQEILNKDSEDAREAAASIDPKLKAMSAAEIHKLAEEIGKNFLIETSNVELNFDGDHIFNLAMGRTAEDNIPAATATTAKAKKDTAKVQTTTLNPKDFVKVQGNRRIIKPVFSYSQSALKAEVKRLAKFVKLDPKRAQATGFDLDNYKFILKEGEPGRTLNEEALLKELVSKLNKGDVNNEFKLPFNIVKNNESLDDVQAKLGLVSQATTYVPYYSESRNGNLYVGSQRINGQLIQPHSVFSVLEHIGAMTGENGYYQAAVEVDGKSELGYGGGLCQVSSTLFQAAAKANLNFPEHHNHGLESAYCKPGTDAMIEDWADLKIENPTDYPYAIVTEYSDDYLTYYIYGPANPNNATIDLEVEHLGWVEPGEDIRIEDKSLPAGTTELIRSAVTGQRTRTYRVYYVDGEMTDSEVLFESYYIAYPAKYRVGTGAAAPTAKPADTTAVPTPEPTADPALESPGVPETTEQPTNPPDTDEGEGN